VARIILIVGALALLLAGIGSSLFLSHDGRATHLAVAAIEAGFGRPPSSDSQSVHFVIAPGDTATTVGANLQTAGVIRSAIAFRLVVRLNGAAGALRSGDYEFRRDQPLAEIVSILAQGRLTGGFLTIPEGWRALQIADALAGAHVTSRDAFMQAVLHPSATPDFLAQLPPDGTLEGYLFPDSYQFEPNTSTQHVVQRMLDDFKRHIGTDLPRIYASEGLTVNQAVILASIVEREAEVPRERPIIASVYLNRFHRGMKLQADPTVQYGLIPPLGVPVQGTYWKIRLTLADLKDPSPFNTYVVDGLPPGPICNPGMASLTAVAHPAQTDFLYFVARPDGTHAFARTLQEQEQNVAKYQQ